MTAPLLGLVMIIRNEAHNILTTLDSILPFVDCATIVDTGSTDGTQEIVRGRLASCGEAFLLHEDRFTDFGNTRNRALELHGQATTFTFMPDADDVLINGTALREFLTGQLDETDGAYMVTIHRPGPRGDLQYALPLVLRANARWRYQGRVHEFVAGPPQQFPQRTVPGVQVRQEISEQSYAQSQSRWSRDLTMLMQDIVENPTEPRWWFYFAQTHECLGNREDAIKAYMQRIVLGGMTEEVYESKFRIAKLMEALERPWPDVQQAYLDAHTFDPRHAEPLDAIARHYQTKDDLPLMHLFARRAAEIPHPTGTILFVDCDVYNWRAFSLASTSAYYVAQRADDKTMTARGRAWAEQAVRSRPNDTGLRFNLSAYAQTISELFPGMQLKQLDFTPADSAFVPLNPSIFFDGKRWRCVIRTTNYRLRDGHYKPDDGGPIRTTNYMAELSDDLRIERVVEMRDLVETPRTEFPVHGFEDCRLFAFGDHLHCTATVCDFTDGQRQMALLMLDDDYSIVKADVLTGPWDRYPQKNWMPIVGRAVPAADFLYRIDPTPVVIPRVFSLPNTDFSPGRLRGGSQAVWVDDGWLVIVHTVGFHGTTRLYTHRFVHLDEDFQIRAMTPSFIFAKQGIEFCAGLARGADPDQLVASFGVGDQTAFLGILSLAEVRAQLKTDYVI